MSIEVFNRYEYKYIINVNVANKLQKELSKRMNIDNYCKNNEKYKIVNLYVDTHCYQLIRDSLEKPLYKHKLRIRTYGDIKTDDDFVYLEIKKKYKGLVNKRRCKLKYKEAYGLIKNKVMPKIKEYMNEQILREIFYILKQDQFEIKTKIIYERIAFFSEDRKLRVSFDYNIHSNRIKHLNDNYVLMEVKTPDSIPMWLVNELDKLEIKSSSFSKYGLDYKELLKRRKNERINI